MAEPTETKHREIVERALAHLASMPPRELLPSNNVLGEQLARSISRTKTRHRVVRFIGSQYAINGAPHDSTRGVQAVETDLARELASTSAVMRDYKPTAVPRRFGKLVVDYFQKYLDDRAGLSRWLLFCAIATVPGELAPDDAADREEFRQAIGAWLEGHLEGYASEYRAIIDGLDRVDREDDGLLSLAHALGLERIGAQRGGLQRFR